MQVNENGLVPVTTKVGYEGKHIYEILMERLQRLERMLVAYGFADPIPRIHLHLGILKRLREKGGIDTDEILWSLVEGTELADIYCSLPDMTPRTLREKFKAILDGPHHPQQETTASNLSRNTMFEVHLASWLTYKGIVTTMSHNPDLCCAVADRYVFIQCKRPFGRQKVSDNMKRACKQLSLDLDKAGDIRNRGVVAISLTHALNPRNAFMEVRTEADLIPAMASLIKPVTEHNVSALIRGPRISGAVFSFITAAYVSDLNEYRLGRLLAFYPSQNASPADRMILRNVFLRKHKTKMESSYQDQRSNISWPLPCTVNGEPKH